jgi:hypothetical protein
VAQNHRKRQPFQKNFEMNTEAPGNSAAAATTNPDISLEFQLFPHSETPLHRQDQSSRPFIFSPVEKFITQGTVIQIGRKIDRSKDGLRGTTREDRAQNNVSVDVTHMSTDKKPGHNTPEDCIAFRSKVVSRHHAELYVGEDKQVSGLLIFSCILEMLVRLRAPFLIDFALLLAEKSPSLIDSKVVT